jgi:CheY-like chemotaxis protein
MASLPVTPPAHILVVDDMEKNTRLLTDLLGAKGYRTSQASSGVQALAQIEQAAPDLVLLDVMMPGMSGYEVCRALRANPRHALLPVVMVTALDPAAERVNGLDAGADDFLSKPINPAELLARVRSLLRVKALQDQLLRERGTAPAAPPVAPPAAARRGEFVVLRARWPGQAGPGDAAAPEALLARQQTLQDRVAEATRRHAGLLADDGPAQGLTVLFDLATPTGQAPPDAPADAPAEATSDALARAQALARDWARLGEGLAIGVACGSAVLGPLRRPNGGLVCAALGPAVQRARQLSREAGPGGLRADLAGFAVPPD